MILRDAVGDGPRPPGKGNGPLGDFPLLLRCPLIAENVPSSAFNEFADIVGQAAANDLPVSLLMQFAILFEIRKEFEAADAAFHDAGAVFPCCEVVEMVHSFE